MPFNICSDGDSRGNIVYGSQHNSSGPLCGYQQYPTQISQQSGGLHWYTCTDIRLINYQLGHWHHWLFIMTGEILANNMKSYIFAPTKWVCNPPTRNKDIKRMNSSSNSENMKCSVLCTWHRTAATRTERTKHVFSSVRGFFVVVFFSYTFSEGDNTSPICEMCLEMEEIREEEKWRKTKLIRTMQYSIFLSYWSITYILGMSFYIQKCNY